MPYAVLARAGEGAFVPYAVLARASEGAFGRICVKRSEKYPPYVFHLGRCSTHYS